MKGLTGSSSSATSSARDVGSAVEANLEDEGRHDNCAGRRERGRTRADAESLLSMDAVAEKRQPAGPFG
jgi:hypothetical protein